DLYSHGRRLVCLSRVLVDMTSGHVEREVADILAAREALAARAEVDDRRIAVAGFCQGGGFAVIAGTRGEFAAAAVNYGMVPSPARAPDNAHTRTRARAHGVRRIACRASDGRALLLPAARALRRVRPAGDRVQRELPAVLRRRLHGAVARGGGAVAGNGRARR